MASAGELVSNRGDVNLGFGSNAGIPVSFTKDLDAVNQAGRDATLLNVEQQRQLFNRKLKDRDELLKLLQSGDLKVGDHLERDMPVLKKTFDELDNAFAERARKGFNDIDATVAYNKALRKANDTITQAQGRFVIDKQVNADAAANELPSERESMMKEHEGYLGKFWSDYKPHVKAFTIDHPGMTSSILRESVFTNSGVATPPQKTTKRTVTDKDGKVTTVDVVSETPVKGQKPVVGTDGKLSMFTTVPGKRYDYKKMLSNASDDFHDEKQRLNQTKYMDYVLNQTSPAQLKGILDHANARIKTYNEQQGFLTPDVDGYVDPIEIIEGPDGSRNTDLSVPEFNAKMALAGITSDYVEQDKQVFDKDMTKAIQEQKDLASLDRHRRATEGVAWANYNLDKDKFNETVKGGEEAKTAAMVYADNMLNDLISYGTDVGNGHYVLTPDQVRKMTGEQLKYLGRDMPATKNDLGETIPAGLQPLSLKEPTYDSKGNVISEGEALYINPDGTIRVVSTFNERDKKYDLSFDKDRSTSVFNVARNVLNEENQKAGSHEKNGYVDINTRNRSGKVSVDKYGGGTTKSGSTTNKESAKDKKTRFPLPKGQPRQVEQDGNIYTWDEANGVYN